MAEPRKLSPEEFRTMQLLELDMLEELDRYINRLGKCQKKVATPAQIE